MRPVIFIISVLSVGVICFCAQILNWGGNGLDSIGFIKILITAEILMSAAVSDFFIKKIPNFLPLTFLASGVIILIFEYFFMRESFFLLLGSSLIGLVVGFIILLLMSIITKGGIGMGDVKLISTMGFLTGIAASFYTFVLASFLCLAVTIVLLITKVKKMKDELPFGPFIFIGYIFVVILGRF